jgi:hypothetical protein
MSTLSDSDRAALREEVKREVKKELHREGRTRLWWRIFWYLLILGVPTAIVAVTLAKSGMMQIPLLTKSLYRPVSPTRLVSPLVGSDAEVIWREALASAKQDRTIVPAEVTMSMDESRLTTVIRQGLANQASALPFKADDAQIALDHNRAELFFNTERGGEKVPVRLTFLPSVDRSGKLTVEVTEVIVGGAGVPAMLRAPMANLLNKFLRNEFTSQMPAGFILRRFEVQPEGLTIVFTSPSK